jgi:hypothetical protein
MGQVVQSPVFPVPLACCIYQGQIPGPACVQEVLLDLEEDLFGNPDADEPPVATVSPSCITCTASRAETIWPFLMREGGNEDSMGWILPFLGMATLLINSL